MITIAGDGTVDVAVSVRNNLKTRTSLRPVSILLGEDRFEYTPLFEQILTDIATLVVSRINVNV